MQAIKKAAHKGAADENTLQDHDTMPTAVEQGVCAACGRPLGLMAYETPDGDLLHPDERCLAEYMGAILSVSDSILFSGREVPCSAQTSNS